MSEQELQDWKWQDWQALVDLERTNTAEALRQLAAARTDAEALAAAVTEWNRAKQERDDWASSGKQMLGGMPPLHLLDNAKLANEMLTAALANHVSLAGGTTDGN